MKGIYGIEVNMTKLIKEYMIEQVFIYVKKILFLKNIHVLPSISGDKCLVSKFITNFLPFFTQVQGGHILVIGGGSESPWIETILLELGAARITTLHLFSSVIELDHPKMNMITPEDLRRAYIKGQAPTFDAMISFSALQHRYQI